MTLYPQCGHGVRCLEDHEVNTLTITRLLETTLLRRVPLVSGQWLYYDGNAIKRGIRVNKRVTLVLRGIDPALLKGISDSTYALRGHAILMTAEEHACLK